MGLIGIENYVILDGDSQRAVKPIAFADDPILGKIISKEWYHGELGLSFVHVAQIYLAIDRISEASVPL